MKKTSLYEKHLECKGRMTEFGGWELPVQYSGILEEHRSVRDAAGIFDVSHMGEITVTGRGARAFLQKVLTNDLSRAKAGRCVYSPMCYPDGGTVDDLLVYVRSEESFLLVVNAANTDKDFNWLQKNRTEGAELENVSAGYAQLAVQGPASQNILQRLTNTPLDEIGYYRFQENVAFGGSAVILSRTGYTGSDGFELYFPSGEACGLWDKILEAGKKDGLIPAGLGARDTLRLEAALPLYGHELSDTISPLEAGLGRFVRLNKEDFIGREALLTQNEKGIPRALCGFRITGRGIARAGYEVHAQGKTIGAITSGGFSPTLDCSIALALTDRAIELKTGDTVTVAVRGKEIEAEIVPTPFYSIREKNL